MAVFKKVWLKRNVQIKLKIVSILSMKIQLIFIEKFQLN